jgi:hypothetical protein
LFIIFDPTILFPSLVSLSSLSIDQPWKLKPSPNLGCFHLEVDEVDLEVGKSGLLLRLPKTSWSLEA